MAWIIEVRNYGAFLFSGSEAEANVRCSEKSAWEGERGIVRPATPEEAVGGKISRTLQDDPIC